MVRARQVEEIGEAVLKVLAVERVVSCDHEDVRITPAQFRQVIYQLQMVERVSVKLVDDFTAIAGWRRGVLRQRRW